MNPLVSIITPCFNSSKFITETINSVIHQSYENWEMIIIDDNSIDESKEVINNCIKGDRRIKLIELQENVGPAIARNKGIEISKGNFIAFLDSDDSWLPSKLKRQILFMQTNSCALSFSSYYIVDENGQKKKFIKAEKIIDHKDLLQRNFIGCLTAMYSVDMLGKVYFPIIEKRQDWALWLIITNENRQAYGLDKPLALYRKRKNSLSHNKFKLLKYNWIIYRKIEKLSIFKSVYYFIIWMFYGMKKYYF